MTFNFPAPSHSLWRTTQAQLPGAAFSIKPRRDLTNKTTPSQTPAPNKYAPQRLLKSHSFSIGMRLKSESELNQSSCNKQYNSTKAYKRLYDVTPSWTMQSRTILNSQTKGNRNKPAPNNYFPKTNPKLRRAPSWSFRPRLQHGSPLESMGCKNNPGPSAYYLPSCVGSQKYQYPITIKARRYVINKQKLNHPAPNLYKPTRGSRPVSARAWTMAGRINSKSKRHMSPGPIYNVCKPMGYQKRF